MTEVVDASDTIVEALSSKLTITYPNAQTVEFGQELTPTDVKDEPSVSWEADHTKYYTLLMYDPDAPSRLDPKFADVKHWLVVNVLGNDVKSGEVIAEYVGSGPPKGSGLHRYIFLVYEQKGKLEFNEPKSSRTSRDHRISWSMREFRKKYDLGKAYAGNYFVAQWDSYVDELKRQVQESK